LAIVIMPTASTSAPTSFLWLVSSEDLAGFVTVFFILGLLLAATIKYVHNLIKTWKARQIEQQNEAPSHPSSPPPAYDPYHQQQDYDYDSNNGAWLAAAPITFVFRDAYEEFDNDAIEEAIPVSVSVRNTSTSTATTQTPVSVPVPSAPVSSCTGCPAATTASTTTTNTGIELALLTQKVSQMYAWFLAQQQQQQQGGGSSSISSTVPSAAVSQSVSNATQSIRDNLQSQLQAHLADPEGTDVPSVDLSSLFGAAAQGAGQSSSATLTSQLSSDLTTAMADPSSSSATDGSNDASTSSGGALNDAVNYMESFRPQYFRHW
jgi:hypothetical protein